MDTTHTITIIVSILVPMLAGFGWILHQIKDLDDRIRGVEKRLADVETRLTIMETILSLCGVPIKGHIATRKIQDQE